jgi:hypothetical protein
MQVETDEPEVIERVAALDVGKAEVVCCARVPGPGGQRMQEVRMTGAAIASATAATTSQARLQPFSPQKSARRSVSTAHCHHQSIA